MDEDARSHQATRNDLLAVGGVLWTVLARLGRTPAAMTLASLWLELGDDA